MSEETHRAALAGKPWATSPRYFQEVRLQFAPLLAMLRHAAAGGDIEVMGLVAGFVDGPVFNVTMAFPLPVEGTETRVNAQAQGYEFMVNHMEKLRQAGLSEFVLGWYHSHPGYGPWLSGIDVDTQAMNQQFQDPFVAIVIDPKASLATGRVSIGAFRTLAEREGRPVSITTGSENEGRRTMHPAKIREFGVHAHRYYELALRYDVPPAQRQELQELESLNWHQLLGRDATGLYDDLLSSPLLPSPLGGEGPPAPDATSPAAPRQGAGARALLAQSALDQLALESRILASTVAFQRRLTSLPPAERGGE